MGFKGGKGVATTAGVITFIGDFLKCVIAVVIGGLLFSTMDTTLTDPELIGYGKYLAGMCCFLVWDRFIPGALLCVAGVVGMLAAPWLYHRLVEKRKRQIAPEILRLTEELSRK